LIASPAQLLLALAEHGSVEAASAVLGIERDQAMRLLRGAAKKLAEGEAKQLPERDAKPRSQSAEWPDDAPKGPVERVRIFTDGAARGNPGPAGAGAVILDPQGRVLARLGKYLGRQTNNVAEYEGLLLGLKRAKELGARSVEVRADSLLLVKQLQGEYAVKNAALKELHAKARELLRQFDRVEIRHVPREENTLADEMSNRAIDEKLDGEAP
jgi:ribonuclease HI